MEPSINYLVEFQSDVENWREQQPFGEGPSTHPTLYVWEEYAELVSEKSAQGASDMKLLVDAVGDIMVSLADVCSRRDIDLATSLSFTPHIPREGRDPLEWFVANAGAMTRSIVKQEQGIRLDEERIGVKAEREAVSGMVSALAAFSSDHGFDLEEAMTQAFYGEVIFRDWAEA